MSLVVHSLKPQAKSLLFAAVLLLLQPIQMEEVDRVLQSVGLIKTSISGTCNFLITIWKSWVRTPDQVELQVHSP